MRRSSRATVLSCSTPVARQRACRTANAEPEHHLEHHRGDAYSIAQRFAGTRTKVRGTVGGCLTASPGGAGYGEANVDKTGRTRCAHSANEMGRAVLSAVRRSRGNPRRWRGVASAHPEQRSSHRRARRVRPVWRLSVADRPGRTSPLRLRRINGPFLLHPAPRFLRAPAFCRSSVIRVRRSDAAHAPGSARTPVPRRCF